MNRQLSGKIYPKIVFSLLIHLPHITLGILLSRTSGVCPTTFRIEEQIAGLGLKFRQTNI